jgi:hypothetical protein
VYNEYLKEMNPSTRHHNSQEMEMRKFYLVFTLAAFALSQPIFAKDSSDSDSDKSSCKTIAKACVDAGFAKGKEGKKFWKECMKPIILGQSVKGVTVDDATVKSCREAKIVKMQKELKEMQDVK